MAHLNLPLSQPFKPSALWLQYNFNSSICSQLDFKFPPLPWVLLTWWQRDDCSSSQSGCQAEKYWRISGQDVVLLFIFIYIYVAMIQFHEGNAVFVSFPTILTYRYGQVCILVIIIFCKWMILKKCHCLVYGASPMFKGPDHGWK